MTEDELEVLGRGSPGSLYLNLGLALFPVGVAFLIALLSTDILAVGGKIFFISSCIIFFLAGIIFFILAASHHVSNKSLVEKIKNRMPPPEPIAAEAAEPEAGSDKPVPVKEPLPPAVSPAPTPEEPSETG